MCILGLSRETEHIAHSPYTHTHTLQGIGSCNYGGWEVPRPIAGKTETQGCWCVAIIQKSPDPRRADITAWIQRPEKTNGSAKSVKQAEFSETFLFYSDLQLIEWGPPTLVREICFIQSTNSNVNLTKMHPHRCIQNNIWSKSWAPRGPVKLTHNINRHIAPSFPFIDPY